MENTTLGDQAKIDQIKRLLEQASPNGTVCTVRKWHDWMQYEVVCGANKSVLCVSFEFIGLDETEIAKRFERAGVARTIQKSPNESFILMRSGLQQR